jgi:tight adherence protein C
VTADGVLVMVGVGLALARAVAAIRDDRLLNRAGRRGAAGGRAQPLLIVGRPLVHRLPMLSRRPALLAGGRAARAAAAAGLAADDVPALRAGAMAVFGGVAMAGGVVIRGGAGAVVALAGLALGFAYADLGLRAPDATRRERVEQEAPALLELTAAAVAAGVRLDAALTGAREAVSGPLGEELDRARASMELGQPRRAELRDLAERTGSPALAGLALAVSLSDRLGVPLAEPLRRQARRARAERARTVQERAAAAGPKVLLVVVFVMVPAAMLPLVVAAGLTVSRAVTGL